MDLAGLLTLCVVVGAFGLTLSAPLPSVESPIHSLPRNFTTQLGQSKLLADMASQFSSQSASATASDIGQGVPMNQVSRHSSAVETEGRTTSAHRTAFHAADDISLITGVAVEASTVASESRPAAQSPYLTTTVATTDNKLTAGLKAVSTTDYTTGDTTVAMAHATDYTISAKLGYVSSKLTSQLLITQTTVGLNSEHGQDDISELTTVNQGNTLLTSDDEASVDSSAHAPVFVQGEQSALIWHSVNIVDDVTRETADVFLDLCHAWCGCSHPATYCSQKLQEGSSEDSLFLLMSNLTSFQQTLHGLSLSPAADHDETRKLLAVYTVTHCYAHFVDVMANDVLRPRCGRNCDVTRCSDVASIPDDQESARQFCRVRNLFQTFDNLMASLQAVLSAVGIIRPALQTPTIPTYRDGTQAVQLPMFTLAAVVKEMGKVKQVMEQLAGSVRPSLV